MTGLLAVTSFIAFGSFGTARGAIGFGAVGIGFAAAAVPVVAALAWLGRMDFVPRFPDSARPRAKATEEVAAGALAVSADFWSAFNLLGTLWPRDSLWLVVTDAAAAPAAGSPGCAVAVEDSPAAGWCAVSARLWRMLCTGPVLRARDFDGDTEPDTIHANNTYASVKIDHFQNYFPSVIDYASISQGNLDTLQKYPHPPFAIQELTNLKP